MKSIIEIEKEANLLLKSFDIFSPPIDVNDIANKLGVKVITDFLPEDISGVLDVSRNPAKILVNANHHEHRRRFTIAHELGHLRLHNYNSSIHVDKKSFYRDSKSQEGLIDVEKEANRFAAALLMPEEMIREKLITYGIDLIDLDHDVILEISKSFFVSTTAFSIRLQSLGILSSDE